MIRLTDQDVAEFQDLYSRHTGRELPPARARLTAESLVELVARIHQLDSSSDHFPDTSP